MTIFTAGERSKQLIRMGFINCYLVREDDGLTLIDTTMRGAGKEILRIAAALQVGPIRRILLTHAHVDHIGALDELSAALDTPAPEVLIGRRESLLLARPPITVPQPGEVPQKKSRGGLPGAHAKPTRLLEAGELVGSLRVIATPGHTPGHMSYLDTRDGTLYAGDAMVTIGGAPHIQGVGPWYFPFPRFAMWDGLTSIESVRALAALPITRLAPGHGRVLEGDALIDRALAEVKN